MKNITIFTDIKALRHWLCSLFISAIASCLVPLGLLGGSWLMASSFCYLPMSRPLGDFCLGELYNLLRVFGSGSPWFGVTVIVVTFGFVGTFFELFNIWQYQSCNAKG